MRRFRRLLVPSLLGACLVAVVPLLERKDSTATPAPVCRWDPGQLTYYIGPNTAGLPRAAYRGAIRDALLQWTSLVPLTAVELPSPQSAAIVVSWIDDPSDPLHPPSIARGELPPNCSHRTRGLPKPLVFTTVSSGSPEYRHYRWSTGGEPETFDVESVALHEFGHMLGLGHCEGPCSDSVVMSRYIRPGQLRRTLHSSDRAQIKTLYGR